MSNYQHLEIFNNLIPALERIVDCEGITSKPIAFKFIFEKLHELINAGDVVIIGLPNSSFLIKVYFSILARGAVPILVSPAMPAVRLQKLIANFNVNVVIKNQGQSRSFYDQGHTLDHALGLDILRLPHSGKPLAQPGEVILTTSGTSGIGSGCVFDFASLVKNARKHAGAINLTAQDTVLVNLPIYYSYAFVAQMLAAILVGGRLVIDCPPFEPKSYLANVKKHGVTVSSLTPLLARNMVDAKVKFSKHLRAITIGGDQIEAAYIKELLNLRPNKELYITYGLTEAGPRVATLNAHAEPATRFASVGRPLPDTKIKIRPTEGLDIGGELLVSSDTLFKRKIKEMSDGVRVEESNGTLATGDLFHCDEDGYLYYQARLSDFLIVKGEKISLHSVRQLIKKIPHVLSVQTKPVHQARESYFDLFLTVADTASNEIHAQLKESVNKILLPYERPRNIHLNIENIAQGVFAHK